MAELLHSSSYDYNFKLAIIGNSGVGKTCVLTRYTDNQFQTSFLSTIGRLLGWAVRGGAMREGLNSQELILK